MTARRNLACSLTLIAALGLVAVHGAGCSRMYYSAMETVGSTKRDILVSRVQKANVEQEEAKEQFRSAYEQFKTLVNFDGGDLEKEYNRLDREYQRCQSKAEDLRGRVDGIEDVGQALFREWEGELDDYTNDEYRRRSERQLNATRERFDDLLVAMRDVERRMEPVLLAFRDQVLFLKHNLNAQAIASLEGTSIELEREVALLIEQMEDSINESRSFLDQMGTTK